MLTAKILSDENYIPSLIKKQAIKTWENEWITILYQSNCLSSNFEQLLDILVEVEDEQQKKLIFEKILILGYLEEIEFESWGNKELVNLSTLGKVVEILESGLFTQSKLTYKREEQYLNYKRDQLVFNYKDYFFDNLFQHLSAQGEFLHLSMRSYSNSVKVSLYNLIVDLGDNIIRLIEFKVSFTFFDIYSLLSSSELPVNYDYEDSREVIKFKNSWFEICLIVNLIINKKRINLSDFKGIEEKEFFNIYWFIGWYAEQNIQFFEDETIEFIFKTVDKVFENEIQETNERCNYFSNLAKIALLHQNSEYIKKYSFQCWDLILGYGWRKDMGIFEVLDSIEYLSQKNTNDALLYLQEISPEVTQILEYTDGKETRHAMSQYTDLLSKLNLSCLTSKFQYEVMHGDWHNAERSFHKILINLPDLSSCYFEALSRTGLSNDDLYALEKNNNSTRARVLIEIALDHNGISQLPELIKENNSSTKDDEFSYINYNDYPLEKFPDFLKLIKADYKNRDHLLLWMKYWEPKVRKSEFIKYVWNYIKDNNEYYKDENLLLDPLYEIAKSTKGKKFAFDVIVKAHSNKGGWFNYWFESTEQTLKRLDVVAQDYKDRADEFIQRSTQNDKGLDIGLVIPSSRLVYLLVQLNRIEEAKLFIEEMIKVLKEETRSLNLRTPNWNWNQKLDEHEIALTLLTTRLHWPFTSIKQWVANELSTILAINDPNKIVEAKLLASLKSKKLESEVVEILCIFWIASQKSHKSFVDIGSHIFARSCLSDELLKSIDIKTTNYGSYIGDFEENENLVGKEFNFRKNLGAEFPYIYLNFLDDLESEYPFPFTEDFKHEWNKTFINESITHDTYQYFLEKDNTAQFYTLNSHRARSAYLRVFEIAKRRYGMPEDYANFFSIKALPLETSYLNFLPRKASWFRTWDYQHPYSIKAVKIYLQSLIHECNRSNHRKILGALSFPIELNSNLHLNITCTLLNGKNEATQRSQIDSIGLGLEKYLEFNFIGQKNQKLANHFSFIGTPYPRHRYGHWYVEQDSRGIYVPIIPNTEFKIIGRSENNVIKYLLNDIEIGLSGYWNEVWKRTYPSKMKPKCATYTLLDEQYFQYLATSEKDLKYICHLTIVSREYDYREYEFEEITLEI